MPLLLSPVELSIAISLLSGNLLIIAQWQQFRRTIATLTTCPIYGCLTRQGVDMEWARWRDRQPKPCIIFFDIDGMKEANTAWGYSEVNRRIAAVMSQIRSNERSGRWFSGDEIVIICPESEAYQTADRIRLAFIEQEMGATFAIAPCISPLLEECVQPASDAVQVAKGEGRRGTIN
jgi:GGDEF domain-containing protein